MLTFINYCRGQPPKKPNSTRYTDTILTAVFADGTQIPPMLFTCNRAFKTRQNYTSDNGYDELNVDQKERLDYVQAQILYAGVKPQQVIYVDQQGQYCHETKEMVRTWTNHQIRENKIPDGCVILSDAGNAFKDTVIDTSGKRTRVSIITPLLQTQGINCKWHEFIPHLHHLLSPNDNNLHAVAKATWRASNVDMDDSVQSSLELLKHLERVSSRNIVSWFQTNLRVGKKRASQKQSEDFVSKGRHEMVRRSPHLTTALLAYCRDQIHNLHVNKKTILSSLPKRFKRKYRQAFGR